MFIAIVIIIIVIIIVVIIIIIIITLFILKSGVVMNKIVIAKIKATIKVCKCIYNMNNFHRLYRSGFLLRSDQSSDNYSSSSGS